jgi:hypothetical protein
VKDAVSKPSEARGKPEASADAPIVKKNLGKRLRDIILEPYTRLNRTAGEADLEQVSCCRADEVVQR